jgi:hypothetical protein
MAAKLRRESEMVGVGFDFLLQQVDPRDVEVGLY